MKTKTHIIFTILLLTLSNNITIAQVSLQTILQKCSDQTLPFEGNKRQMFIRDIDYAITNKDGVLHNKLYQNIQLTEYYQVADGDMEAHELFRKFSIPSSNNKLLVISMGGVSDYRTDILAIVSPTGKVLDQLIGRAGFTTFCIMQYKISVQGEVLISQLVPTESSSIDFDHLTKFTGYRIDKTYTITPEGKFQETSVKKFQPKLYTRTFLENKEYNLWNGTETPDN